MEQLALSPQYLTGITSIDEQHSKLIEILNALNKIIEEQQDEGQALRIADEFIAYTQYHFKDEERLMAENGYPDLNIHCQMHQSITQHMEKTVHKYKGSKFLRYKIFQIGMNILMNHIEKEDQKFAKFVNTNK